MRFAAIAACLLLLACQPKPAPARDESAIDKEIVADVTAMLEAWAKSGTEGDWDGIAKLYADDEGFAWIERGQVRYPTREAAIAGLEGVKAVGSKVETHVSETVVTPLSDESAAFRARVRFKLDLGEGVAPVDVDAMLTGVAFEYEDGWKFLQGHMESRPGIPAPAPAAPAEAPR